MSLKKVVAIAESIATDIKEMYAQQQEMQASIDHAHEKIAVLTTRVDVIQQNVNSIASK